MNFLAHMLLSCEKDTVVTGNFLGDLLRNHEIAALPPDIQAGVRLHRKIDSFTDSHPAIKKSTHLLHPRHGKYAPVLVDVFYDFFLARNWPRFHSTSLEAFVVQIYEQLLAHLEVMPLHTQRQVQAMVDDNFLMNYESYEGMEITFRRMSRRVSRPQQLQGTVDTLRMFEPRLEQHFLAFFPELQAYVQGECEELLG